MKFMQPLYTLLLLSFLSVSRYILIIADIIQEAINIISFTVEPLSEFHQLLISCLPI